MITKYIILISMLQIYFGCGQVMARDLEDPAPEINTVLQEKIESRLEQGLKDKTPLPDDVLSAVRYSRSGSESTGRGNEYDCDCDPVAMNQ